MLFETSTHYIVYTMLYSDFMSCLQPLDQVVSNLNRKGMHASSRGLWPQEGMPDVDSLVSRIIRKVYHSGHCGGAVGSVQPDYAFCPFKISLAYVARSEGILVILAALNWLRRMW